MSCPFSNIFGVPGTGAHSIRFMGVAIVDVIFTIILAYFTKGRHPFWKSLIIWFLVGIIAHRIFCVRTTIDKIIFG